MKNSSATILDDSNRCFQICLRTPRLLLLSGLSLWFAVSSLAAQTAVQEPADKTATTSSVVRPCPVLPANPARKNKTKSRGAADSKEVGPACLEAKGSALDFQEFFQSHVRAQSWQISGEKIIEDGWIFSRYLNKDELLQFAKEGLFAGRVNWTEGKALIQVETRELDGGFTRVEVTAKFQGGGQSVDRFAPPRDSWDLDSNGALEKNLITALEAHVKSLH